MKTTPRIEDGAVAATNWGAPFGETGLVADKTTKLAGRNGIPLLPSWPPSLPVTPELVNRLRDEPH